MTRGLAMGKKIAQGKNNENGKARRVDHKSGG
jgi:hypothetical protein